MNQAKSKKPEDELKDGSGMVQDYIKCAHILQRNFIGVNRIQIFVVVASGNDHIRSIRFDRCPDLKDIHSDLQAAGLRWFKVIDAKETKVDHSIPVRKTECDALLQN
jgi:hypothetical protein